MPPDNLHGAKIEGHGHLHGGEIIAQRLHVSMSVPQSLPAWSWRAVMRPTVSSSDGSMLDQCMVASDGGLLCRAGERLTFT